MLRKGLLFKIILLSGLILVASCTSQKGEKAQPDLLGENQEKGDTEEDVGNGPQPTKVDEDFKVAMLYTGRMGYDTAGRTELAVFSVKAPEKVKFLTKGKEWSCQDGCILSKDWNYLGVYHASESFTQGPAIEVFQLKDMQIQDKSIVTIKNVADAHFGKDGLYYSTKGACAGDPQDANEYCIHLQPLKAGAKSKELFTFPPRDDAPDYTSGNGIFSVSDDGKTLILLRPTIYSQKVYLWKAGVLKSVGEEICFQRDANGHCTGTGSAYSSSDPVGLSPDGRTVILGALAMDKEYRIYKFKLGDNFKTLSTTYSSLYVTKGTSYTQLACDLRGKDQYTSIRPPILFQNNNRVYFIATADCWPQFKPWTDITGLNLTRIGTGKPINYKDLYNITHTKPDDGANTIYIKDFAFSPSKKYIVFIGTPTLQTNGTPIPAESARHTSDFEVYITEADGQHTPIQLTNSLKYEAIGLWVKKE